MAQQAIDTSSNPLGDFADRDYESKQTLKTKGWQVSSVEDNAGFSSPTGRNFIMLTKEKAYRVVINCYDPGASDEMHCHPGSEHTFLVWQGQLHLTGIEDGEDVTLGPGQFVQIAAGYYYRPAQSRNGACGVLPVRHRPGEDAEAHKPSSTASRAAESRPPRRSADRSRARSVPC